MGAKVPHARRSPAHCAPARSSGRVVMRIVYVGEMLHGSTSGMRRDALIQLGHEVETIDASPSRGYSTTRRTLPMRAWSRLVDMPRLRRGLRRRLFDAVRRLPRVLIYVDK